MQAGVMYDPERQSAYEDFVAGGSPADTTLAMKRVTSTAPRVFKYLRLDLNTHTLKMWYYVGGDIVCDALVELAVARAPKRVRVVRLAPREMYVSSEDSEGGSRRRTALRFVSEHASRDIRALFGPGWEVEVPEELPTIRNHRSLAELDQVHADRREDLIANMCTYSGVLAVYDSLRAAKATIIQAAFRGWRVRHRYRYDPHNRLGAHVIGKMFWQDVT
jgi:hypothetical protein